MDFKATIQRFEEQGEKTGWTYIEIPADVAQEVYPSNKKSFYVKGKLDAWRFTGVCLLPMGKGNFIMPLNAEMRKAIGKRKGATLEVQLQKDVPPTLSCPELMECLADEPGATDYFNTGIANSLRNYFLKWVLSAKTEPTKTKRIAQVVTAMARKMSYSEMIHFFRDQKNK